MCNFHYAEMSIIASQVMKFVNFTKIQKPKNLENKIFFLQIKKFINYTQRAFSWQKILL